MILLPACWDPTDVVTFVLKVVLLLLLMLLLVLLYCVVVYVRRALMGFGWVHGRGVVRPVRRLHSGEKS